jgi:hypothetical protein
MGISGNGSSTSGFVAGGENQAGSTLTATEEWTVPEANTTITVS